ncbi:MAG: YihY/virulence factor BrkB family protein [Oscillospiraceae bacterium]
MTKCRKAARSAFSFTKDILEIYFSNHVSRSAAELSYFITLSIFPTLICIYSMLGSLLPNISLTLSQLEGFIPAETLETITDYLGYVAAHNNSTMLTAGIIGMATTSAAAFRSIHNIMGDIQGVSRFRGIFALAFSFIFSLFLMAAIYFGVIVMITGNWLLTRLASIFPKVAHLFFWPWLRFPLLLLIFALVLYGLYRITAPKQTGQVFFPGAIIGAVVFVGVSILFSWFISISTRYPLVYGSLASIIIFMLWMYICGTILIMGNAVNVVIRRRKMVLG